MKDNCSVGQCTARVRTLKGVCSATLLMAGTGWSSYAEAGCALPVIVAAPAPTQTCTIDPRTEQRVCVTNPLPASSVPGGAGLTGASRASVTAMLSTFNSVNMSVFGVGSPAFLASPESQQPDQPATGVWARGFGGSQKIRNGSGASITDGSFTAAENCDADARVNFAGVQTGIDSGRLNIGSSGMNMHVGLTAGYVGTDSSTINLLTSNFDIPFVGVYFAVTQGNLSADLQVRKDFFLGRMNDATNNILNRGVHAQGMSVSGNINYHYDLGNNYFAEPSVGVAWSQVGVNSVMLPGWQIVTGNPSDSQPTNVQFNTINNILGRASVRLGTSITTPTMVYQPFVTLSIFREFDGSANASLAGISLGPTPATFGQVRVNGIGTYGQFGAGVATKLTNTGWLGFVRGDYRVGDHIEGYAFTAGLRYQFEP